MNREDIIRMGAESKISLYSLGKEKEKFINYLERFATLVTQQEREAILAVIGDNQCECRCSEVVRDRGQA